MDFVENLFDRCTKKEGNSNKPSFRPDGTVIEKKETDSANEKAPVTVVKKKKKEIKCPFKRVWTTTLDVREGLEKGARTPALGKDGTVYVCAEYHLCALGYDGGRRWRVKVHPEEAERSGTEAEGTGKINKKPMVDPVDGTIYVAAGTHASRLHAISPTGERKWMAPRHFKDWMDGQDQADSFQYGGQIAFDPYLGFIYVPGLYGLSGFSRDGHQLWSATKRTGHFDSGHVSTPVVAMNGTVVVASPCEGEENAPRIAYGLNGRSGQLQWSSILENSSNRVGYYAAVSKQNMDAYISCGAVVRCVNAADGTIRWATDLSGPEFGQNVFNIVVSANDDVIVSGFRVCALNPKTGELIAQSKATGGDQVTLDKARDMVYGGRGTALVPFFALSLKKIRDPKVADSGVWPFHYLDDNLDLFPPAVNPFVLGPFGMSLFSVTNLAPASVMCLGQP